VWRGAGSCGRDGCAQQFSTRECHETAIVLRNCVTQLASSTYNTNEVPEDRSAPDRGVA
jgi:hypothetical protein